MLDALQQIAAEVVTTRLGKKTAAAGFSEAMKDMCPVPSLQKYFETALGRIQGGVDFWKRIPVWAPKYSCSPDAILPSSMYLGHPIGTRYVEDYAGEDFKLLGREVKGLGFFTWNEFAFGLEYNARYPQIFIGMLLMLSTLGGYAGAARNHLEKRPPRRFSWIGNWVCPRKIPTSHPRFRLPEAVRDILRYRLLRVADLSAPLDAQFLFPMVIAVFGRVKNPGAPRLEPMASETVVEALHWFLKNGGFYEDAGGSKPCPARGQAVALMTMPLFTGTGEEAPCAVHFIRKARQLIDSDPRWAAAARKLAADFYRPIALSERQRILAYRQTPSGRAIRHAKKERSLARSPVLVAPAPAA